MHRKINLIFSVLFFLSSLGYPVTAASKSGYIEIIVVPKASVYAGGSPLTRKKTGKVKLVSDVGIQNISAELEGYHMASKQVDVMPGKKYKVVLALLKKGQDRNKMESISGSNASIGLSQKRVDWMVKRIGADAYEFANAMPSHEVKLKDYKLDKYEVTNDQYRKFTQVAKHKLPKHWKRGKVSLEIENYPVVNVSYADAAAYCKWKGKRLPTEAEWEYAARGDMGHVFPWGKKFRDGRANYRGSGYNRPTDTGRYEKGAAKFSDCYEMSGNAWEWTDTWYDAYPGSTYKDKDFGKSMRVIRGGSFRESITRISSVFRGKLAPDTIRKDVGFRCAK